MRGDLVVCLGARWQATHQGVRGTTGAVHRDARDGGLA